MNSITLVQQQPQTTPFLTSQAGVAVLPEIVCVMLQNFRTTMSPMTFINHIQSLAVTIISWSTGAHLRWAPRALQPRMRHKTAVHQANFLNLSTRLWSSKYLEVAYAGTSPLIPQFQEKCKKHTKTSIPLENSTIGIEHARRSFPY